MYFIYTHKNRTDLLANLILVILQIFIFIIKRLETKVLGLV